MSAKTSFLEFALNITPRQLSMVVLAFVAVIAPGIALICLFYPGWLMQFDAIKLILVATAFTVPFFLLNWFIINFGDYVHKCNFGETKIMSMALFITALSFYASAPMMFMLGRNIAVFAGCLILVEGFGLRLFLHDARIKYSKEKGTVLLPGIPRE